MLSYHFISQQLISEKSGSLEPREGAQAFMGLFGGVGSSNGIPILGIFFIKSNKPFPRCHKPICFKTRPSAKPFL